MGTWGVLTNIYFKCLFFSFNAVASLDYIYLRAGRVRPGGRGDQGQFDFFLSWGAVGGSKQI